MDSSRSSCGTDIKIMPLEHQGERSSQVPGEAGSKEEHAGVVMTSDDGQE